MNDHFHERNRREYEALIKAQACAEHRLLAAKCDLRKLNRRISQLEGLLDDGIRLRLPPDATHPYRASDLLIAYGST